ncbi:MAG: TA system VapC family ribonuclease toxin [Chloroflexota bacterium]
MILVDANVLIYAYDLGSPRQAQSAAWLERTLSSDEDVRFPLTTLLAFLRITTNPGVFERPLTASRAIGIVSSWLARPNVAVASTTDRHWEVLDATAEAGQARGPLLMDAHLAALASEHGATLATTDRDFARFPRLRTINPFTR